MKAAIFGQSWSVEVGENGQKGVNTIYRYLKRNLSGLKRFPCQGSMRDAAALSGILTHRAAKEKLELAIVNDFADNWQ